MYIVKWLMGHPIAAILALGVIAILLALGSGDTKNTSIEQQTTASLVENNTSTTINSDNVIDGATDSTSRSPQQLSVATNNDKPNTAKKVDKHNKKVVSTRETNGGSKVVNNALTNDDKSQAGPFKTSIPGDRQREDVSKGSIDEISDLKQLDSDAMLQMAREAYWNNGLDEAAQIYLQLIKNEPKVIEHKGELGNVYWRQGYPKKAAELYSEIAIPLIDVGSSDRVENMIGFIELFYPDRVSVIVDRLQRLNNK